VVRVSVKGNDAVVKEGRWDTVESVKWVRLLGDVDRDEINALFVDGD
jgi:hypothetical protein